MKCNRCGAVLPAGEALCQECGSVLPELEGTDLPAGTVIAGKYEIAKQIGAGGMGRVYRAIQSPLGVEVCVKTLHQRATIDPQFVARFEREARTTSKLQHPNIVSVFDFGTHTDGTMYLVMELIRGSSLAQMTRKGRYMPPERAVHILAQVCDALATAHGIRLIGPDGSAASAALECATALTFLNPGTLIAAVGGGCPTGLSRVDLATGTVTPLAVLSEAPAALAALPGGGIALGSWNGIFQWQAGGPAPRLAAGLTPGPG